MVFSSSVFLINIYIHKVSLLSEHPVWLPDIVWLANIVWLPSIAARCDDQLSTQERMETRGRQGGGQAHAQRHAKMEERLSAGTRDLPPLKVGDTVVVQDQSSKPGKWTKIPGDNSAGF